MHEAYIVSACRTAIGGFGGVTKEAGNDVCPARVAALEAGVPAPVPAFTANEACGSSMKATVLGAQSIALGASGARILATSMYAMRARGLAGRTGNGHGRGVASLCLGTAMGIELCS
jgi:acetyl-CoA C-acetyltransferase